MLRVLSMYMLVGISTDPIDMEALKGIYYGCRVVPLLTFPLKPSPLLGKYEATRRTNQLNKEWRRLVL